jgi:hypothetical protein
MRASACKYRDRNSRKPLFTEGKLMKIKPRTYDVGYGRPPKQTRWQKGQCGNPNRIRKRAHKTVMAMIDEFFADEIEIVEQGISRRVTNFEAIFLQLCIKASGANKRAMNVMLMYREFAASRGGFGFPEVEVVNSYPNSERESENE